MNNVRTRNYEAILDKTSIGQFPLQIFNTPLPKDSKKPACIQGFRNVEHLADIEKEREENGTQLKFGNFEG